MRHPNEKRPSGLEAQGRDDATGQISGRTTNAWASRASTQAARGEGFSRRILQTSSSRRRASMGGSVQVVAHE